MVQRSTGFSVRVLGGQVTSAIVKRVGGLAPLLRVVLLWAFGALCMSNLIAWASAPPPSCEYTDCSTADYLCIARPNNVFGGWDVWYISGPTGGPYTDGPYLNNCPTAAYCGGGDMTAVTCEMLACCSDLPFTNLIQSWYGCTDAMMEEWCNPGGGGGGGCSGSCTWYGTVDAYGGYWTRISGCTNSSCVCPCPTSPPDATGNTVSTSCGMSTTPQENLCDFFYPDPCDGIGDADGDGCCDDVDCYTTDPDRCTCDPDDPCDDRGGDGDDDGCCADEDEDDSDPDVCEPEEPPCSCTGFCMWTPKKEGSRWVWQRGTSGCGTSTTCRCCEPEEDAKEGAEPKTTLCQCEVCPDRCADRGGDQDKDGCCKNEDHNDRDDQVCDGKCDGNREVCYQHYPGPDGEVDTDDDIKLPCDKDEPVPEGEPACECEKLYNDDKDGDECCDFDERNEAEMEDPEKGCECCRIQDQW